MFNTTPSEHEIRLARIIRPARPLSEEERKRRAQVFRENLQRLKNELHIPLSLLREVTDAIEAMRPFVEGLLAETPNQTLPNPSDDSDGLENGGH